jgi:hypothetical protein
MLSADSGVAIEMPDGFRCADLMLVPAGGVAPRPIGAAEPETSSA